MPKKPVSEMSPDEAEKHRERDRERKANKRKKKPKPSAVAGDVSHAKAAAEQDTPAEQLAAGLWNTLENIAVAFFGDDMKSTPAEHAAIVEAGGKFLEDKSETITSPGAMLVIAIGGYGLSRAPTIYRSFGDGEKKGDDAANETPAPPPTDEAA